MSDQERQKLMDEIKNEIRSDLADMAGKASQSRILLWLNIVATIVGLSTGIYKIGKSQAASERAILDQAALSARVQTIENGATFGAREYMARDLQWSKATDERMARLESLTQIVAGMQSDIVRIKTLLETHITPVQKSP